MQKLRVALALFLAGTASSLSATPAQDAAAIAALTQAFDPIVKGGPVSPVSTVTAVSIAFVEAGKVKWVRTFGLADFANKRRATDDTLFQAASMSKPVAALAALRLVDQGILDLDQPINPRLRNWHVPTSAAGSTQSVTLAQLLSHTAGLTVSGFEGYEAGSRLPTVVNVLDGATPANSAAVKLFAEPGSSFAYSGGGYTVAQLLMTEATGETFPSLMQRLVLKPLAMRRSSFAQPLAGRYVADAATGYDKSGKAIPGRQHIYPELAAAGLWTTSSDYARFVIAVQNAIAGGRHALLQRRTAVRMTTPVSSGYGLGLDVTARGGRPAIAHGGANEGFRSVFFALLNGSRQGAVVLTNSDDGSAAGKSVLEILGKIYGWGGAEPPRPPRARAPD